MYNIFQIPDSNYQSFSHIKSQIPLNNQVKVHQNSWRNLIYTANSKKSIIYSQSFNECVGIVAVAKQDNNFNVKLGHFDAYDTNSLFFSSSTAPYLESISSNAKVVIFAAGEWQKSEQDKWQLKPINQSISRNNR